MVDLHMRWKRFREIYFDKNLANWPLNGYKLHGSSFTSLPSLDDMPQSTLVSYYSIGSDGSCIHIDVQIG